jgi:hypothetical protein
MRNWYDRFVFFFLFLLNVIEMLNIMKADESNEIHQSIIRYIYKELFFRNFKKERENFTLTYLYIFILLMSPKIELNNDRE